MAIQFDGFVLINNGINVLHLFTAMKNDRNNHLEFDFRKNILLSFLFFNDE
jgi:hypothetical protein